MNEYSEEDYLMISGVQHFEFCKRQWALIHIEQCWDENIHTVNGELLHKKVHDGYSGEKRKDLIISRGMPVYSSKLGLRGICDVVEFHLDEQNGSPIAGRKGAYMPYAVEFKKGAKRADAADILQVAAQSMCLEEMMCVTIPKAMYFTLKRAKKKRWS